MLAKTLGSRLGRQTSPDRCGLQGASRASRVLGNRRKAHRTNSIRSRCLAELPVLMMMVMVRALFHGCMILCGSHQHFFLP